MSTMELEVQKAGLAREILSTTDEAVIQDLWLYWQHHKSVGKTVATTEKKQAAAAFFDKWAGKFSVGEQKTDDVRYNYLVEKYK